MVPFSFAIVPRCWRIRGIIGSYLRSCARTVSFPFLQGIELPVSYLRTREGHWIPLLVLNGTSEATAGVASLRRHWPKLTSRPRIVVPRRSMKRLHAVCGNADRFHDLLELRGSVGRLAWRLPTCGIESEIEGMKFSMMSVGYGRAQFRRVFLLFLQPVRSGTEIRSSLIGSSMGVFRELWSVEREGIGTGDTRCPAGVGACRCRDLKRSE